MGPSNQERPLRQAQGRLFGKLGANGGGASPGVLERVCRDSPKGGRAEGAVDRCSVFPADVFSFGVNVFSFGRDVFTLRADVFSFRADVFSRG